MDAAALLQWTTDARRRRELPPALRDAERDGLVSWLTETAGPVAEVVFAHGRPGKIPDAVPFGLAVAALYGPRRATAAPDDASSARIRAEERYLGGTSPGPAALSAFGEAAESLVTRWTDNGHAAAGGRAVRAGRGDPRRAGGSRGTAQVLAGRSRVLEAGLDARFAALGRRAQRRACRTRHGRDSRAPAEGARPADPASTAASGTATPRSARPRLPSGWPAGSPSPEEPPATLAEAATRMLRSWAWADRALGAHRPRRHQPGCRGLAQVYASLWDAGAGPAAPGSTPAFARKLAAWTEARRRPTTCCCVENLLDRIARPVAEQRPPVIVVLDGMTAAVGCELAEELTGRGTWLEAGRREDGREPVLATVPSVTAISRTSLLTGTLRSGGQAEERAGFAAFWGSAQVRAVPQGRPRPRARPGRLAAEVRDAIARPGHRRRRGAQHDRRHPRQGQASGPAHWTVDEVTYLRPGPRRGPPRRPPGHPHRRPRPRPRPGAGHRRPARRQRREIRLRPLPHRHPGSRERSPIRGPRVLGADGQPGGEVVAAVDEAIHYTPRKAGYHGGASLAEVVVPVITLLPSDIPAPGRAGTPTTPPAHAPAWWDAAPSGTAAGSRAGRGLGQAGAPAAPQAPRGGPRDDSRSRSSPLADVEPAHARRASVTSALRRVVVASPDGEPAPVVRRAPDDASVAALIDAPGTGQAAG